MQAGFVFHLIGKMMSELFDNGRHTRGKLGFVLLATEQSIQDDVIRADRLKSGSRSDPNRDVNRLYPFDVDWIHAFNLNLGWFRLNAIQSKGVAVATPYLDDINEMERRYLEAAGVEVTSIQGFNLERDSDRVRVRPDAIAAFAASVDRPDADGLFISCGALRSIEVIEELEQRLQKPVVVSNQAMVWDCLRLAGIRDAIPGYGKLLRDL